MSEEIERNLFSALIVSDIRTFWEKMVKLQNGSKFGITKVIWQSQHFWGKSSYLGNDNILRNRQKLVMIRHVSKSEIS